MRTKTALQIFAQWERISHYDNTRANVKRLERAAKIAQRYWNNIYMANGIKDRYKTNDTAKCNDIWLNAATPVSIYANNVNN